MKRELLKRCKAQALMLCFSAFALLLLLSLLGYSPDDNAINTAGNFKTRNILGNKGAFLADILLQIWGPYAFLWPLFISEWGRKYFRQSPPRKLFITFVCASISIFFISFIAGMMNIRINQSSKYSFVGLGGHISTLIAENQKNNWLLISISGAIFFGFFGTGINLRGYITNIKSIPEKVLKKLRACTIRLLQLCLIFINKIVSFGSGLKQKMKPKKKLNRHEDENIKLFTQPLDQSLSSRETDSSYSDEQDNIHEEDNIHKNKEDEDGDKDEYEYEYEDEFYEENLNEHESDEYENESYLEDEIEDNDDQVIDNIKMGYEGKSAKHEGVPVNKADYENNSYQEYESRNEEYTKNNTQFNTKEKTTSNIYIDDSSVNKKNDHFIDEIVPDHRFRFLKRIFAGQAKLSQPQISQQNIDKKEKNMLVSNNLIISSVNMYSKKFFEFARKTQTIASTMLREASETIDNQDNKELIITNSREHYAGNTKFGSPIAGLMKGFGEQKKNQLINPPLELLNRTTEQNQNDQEEATNEAIEKSSLLEKTLSDFGVKGEISGISVGPVVTLYELEPKPGTKSSRIIGLDKDIARSLSAISVRMAVIPGKTVIGIELPNKKRSEVMLRDLLEHASYTNSRCKLPLAIGKSIDGTPIISDLAKMPHLLIAGTTGSGKSVAINAMIISLLFKLGHDECKFIMIDPKMLELSIYEGIPHLLSPIITNPNKAVNALKWAVGEMENRYSTMSKIGVRNIDEYNKRVVDSLNSGEKLRYVRQTGFNENGKPTYIEKEVPLIKMPAIVIIVDEMADLMLIAGKEIEALIQRLAQMARAAGIHIILATQRPSVDVITGVIKANFPTRISFQVASKIDSRTILNDQGAESLLGKGDMLCMQGGNRILRAHGPFVTDEEIRLVAQFLRNLAPPQYAASIRHAIEAEEQPSNSKSPDKIETRDYSDNSDDNLYLEAVEIVKTSERASISYIQRHLRIGYNKAANLIEKMEREGIVGRPDANGKRRIIGEEAR